MPSKVPSTQLSPEATESYRRFEAAYHQLRAAHNHLRANLSRSVHGEASDAFGRELQNLVRRIERSCFEYRLAAREFVETASPSVESSRANPERADLPQPVAETARKEAGKPSPGVPIAPSREAAASRPASAANAGASAPPAETAVPNTAAS